jgi:hypothetical protein
MTLHCSTTVQSEWGCFAFTLLTFIIATRVTLGQVTSFNTVIWKLLVTLFPTICVNYEYSMFMHSAVRAHKSVKNVNLPYLLTPPHIKYTLFVVYATQVVERVCLEWYSHGHWNNVLRFVLIFLFDWNKAV